MENKGTAPAIVGKGRTTTTAYQLDPTKTKIKSISGKKDSRIQPSGSGIVFIRPRLTAMRTATSRERHAHRKVEALTLPFYIGRGHTSRKR